MIGLSQHERDGSLPALAGDADLTAPTADEVLALVPQVLEPAAAPPVAARWTYARWKPRTSLTTSWNVELGDGEVVTCVLKRYAGDKPLALRDRVRGPGEALLFAHGLHLWLPMRDRELPGLERIVDLHRTTRLLRELRCLEPWVVRQHSSRAAVLRYRPERRAVVALDFKLQFAQRQGPERRGRIAARVLPPAEAARTARMRTLAALAGAASLMPRFLGAQARAGLIFEEWIEGYVPPPDELWHATVAGRLLRALHALPLAGGIERAAEPEPGALAPLLAWLPGGPAAMRSLAADAAPARATWIHGDLHPDQIAFPSSGGAPRLLDLDRLSGGDPRDDLAGWIADHLERRPADDFERAASALLEGYGRALSELGERALRARTARALRLKAAAAVRRLERGAPERAVRLLVRALDVQGSQCT